MSDSRRTQRGMPREREPHWPPHLRGDREFGSARVRDFCSPASPALFFGLGRLLDAVQKKGENDLRADKVVAGTFEASVARWQARR